MGHFTRQDHLLIWQENQHKVWLQASGLDSLRVQANVLGRVVDVPQALVGEKPGPAANI